MTRKHLAVLLVIAGVLAVAVVIKHLGKESPDIVEEVGLTPLAPGEFSGSKVDAIEIYAGAKTDEKVVLKRKGEAAWVVASRFDAPGKNEKITKFLKTLKNLEGEKRSEGSDVLDAYKLEDEQALHVRILRKEAGASPWVHLLVGKKEDHSRSFVRLAGADTVYTVDVNLASDLGVWGDDFDKAPPATEWVDKTVVDLEKDAITRIALVTPDRRLVFEKREVPAEGDKGEGAEGTEETAQKPKKTEWVVAEGGKGLTFKTSGVEDLLRGLDSFSGSDVVDPAKRRELGLDAPGFRCEVTHGKDLKTVLIAAGEPGSKVHVMVEGRDTIYEVADWKFSQLFVDGKDLFELPSVSADKDKMAALRVKTPGYELSLDRETQGDAKAWALDSPKTGLAFKSDKGKDVAESAAEWEPVDFVEGKDLAACGLTDPQRVVTVDLAEGKKHTVRIGGESEGAEGRYALLDDDARIWVVSKDAVEKVTPPLKELFDLEVSKITRDKIRKIEVERKEAPFELQRDGDAWALRSDKKDVAVDSAKVDDYIGRFATITAEDLTRDGERFGQTRATLRVDLDEGPDFVMEFGEERDGRVAVRASGTNVVLFCSGSLDEELAPPLRDLVDLSVSVVDVQTITEIRVKRHVDSFRLVKQDGKWGMRVGSESVACDAAKADALARAVADVDAGDVVLGREDLLQAPTRIVEVLWKDGDKEGNLVMPIGGILGDKMAIGPVKDGLVFLVDNARLKDLMPASKDMARAEEEK